MFRPNRIWFDSVQALVKFRGKKLGFELGMNFGLLNPNLTKNK
jgi:hypothetical protein